VKEDNNQPRTGIISHSLDFKEDISISKERELLAINLASKKTSTTIDWELIGIQWASKKTSTSIKWELLAIYWTLEDDISISLERELLAIHWTSKKTYQSA
jgi:hypothetical protein